MKVIAVLALLSLCTGCTANGETQVIDLIIAVDVSGSTALIADPAFAEAVSRTAHEEIRTLGRGSTVQLKTFGAGGFNHLKRRRLIISTRWPPQKAASFVASEIVNISRTASGERSTNLLAFFETEDFGCGENSTKLWVATDGIEDSIDIDADKLLKGETELPNPDKKGLLSGCSVALLGVGHTKNGRLSRTHRLNLEKAWTKWLKTAGADSVRIVVNPG